MDFLIREAKEQDYEGIIQLYDEIALLHAEALPQIFIKADTPFWNKEYISGIAEVIKYGAIMDASLIPYLEENMDSLLGQDHAVLEEVVSRSARAKVRIVEQDEKEGGIRRLLNFGHTLGHAIERETRLLHGYAISIGMVLAARLSENLGMLSPADARRLENAGRIPGSTG